MKTKMNTVEYIDYRLDERAISMNSKLFSLYLKTGYVGCVLRLC